MSRKAIKGVLHNFLGTYTSRYSDYDGYWLFGMVLSELEQFNINLLDTGEDAVENTPTTVAVRLAATKFREQLEKAGLSLSCVREANLAIIKSPDLIRGYVNGHMSDGFDVSFAARARSPNCKTYECKKSLFVAPHDPKVELRSARGI